MAKAADRRISSWLWVGLCALIGLAAWVTLQPPPPVRNSAASTNQPRHPAQPAASGLAGAVLAERVCATCHLFPEPELMDRFTWTNSVLPRMSGWLGFDTVDWLGQPGGEQALASGRIPRTPTIDLGSLRAIYDYYLETAPVTALPQPAKPSLALRPSSENASGQVQLSTTNGLGLFHVRLGTPSERSARTSLVRIDSRDRQLWVCQNESQRLSRFAADAKLIEALGMTNPVVHLLERADGYYATRIGSITPSDLAQGDVVHLRRSPNGTGYEMGPVVLSGLHRPVATRAADFNHDGVEDLVVAAFGNVLGRFSWFEGKPGGRFEEHILLDRPGAVGVGVHDFDGNGFDDIVVAMAQAQEGLWLFENEGQGRFKEVSIAQKHPAWGLAHLELVDFDQDGRMDLLVSNGDNGDNETRANCLKPYHGVRLYLNRAGRFEEIWFYPMYGAYRALARDFDSDGDLDIAAVAFFPDYSVVPNESFVYLENQGALQFHAHTIVQAIAGRWVTLDAGDLDGDGDLDIVLGASNFSFGDVPRRLEAAWEERGPSILLLENRIRGAAGP